MTIAKQKNWDRVNQSRESAVNSIKTNEIADGEKAIVRALIYVGDCILATHPIVNDDHIYDY
jgi:hypothetical protein